VFDSTGAGLGVVDSIASNWGTELHAGGGKRVWARLGIEPATSTDLICNVA
jgi:hypothetical protein